MNKPLATEQHLYEATLRQRRASDPNASVWVGASAGTGKTKVLTDRVLTMLLAGIAPHKILCLTFTKAAAAEMSNRIAKRLGQWAVMDDQALGLELEKLLGRPPETGHLLTARRLFARVLDVAGGMRIETIHAFCQSLLKRFPLEANVPPHFQVMDERDTAQLLADSREHVILEAWSGRKPELNDALTHLTGQISGFTFDKIVNSLTLARSELARSFRRFGSREGVIHEVATLLGLKPGETRAALIDQFLDALDHRAMRDLGNELLHFGKLAVGRADKIHAFLGLQSQDRPAGINLYLSAFLTQKGKIDSRLIPSKLNPTLAERLSREAERAEGLKVKFQALELLALTSAILTIGWELLEAFRQRKAMQALMDFDDLILAARELLSGAGTPAWVQYKLDGGIDHILIDEAQDTNPDQWAVVKGLTEEFFADIGADTHNRTIFAVGDIKQSIYSFQRADPKAFTEMRDHFRQQVDLANRRWEPISLNLSFRSTDAVISAVNDIFAKGPVRAGVANSFDEDLTHYAHRSGHAGRVELWPCIQKQTNEDADYLEPSVEQIQTKSSDTLLAEAIAKRIAQMIDSEILASKNRPIRAGDIMILLRKRHPFMVPLVRALKGANVPVAGVDRMVLTEQLAVMDLTNLGEFLCQPFDDLALATLLKSPLFGWSEDDLFQLAHKRKSSLWESLLSRQAENDLFAGAASQLKELLTHLDLKSPFAFYAHVLGPLGGKKKLLARLGAEAEDPLDEFLSLTLSFEQSHPPTLQGFLAWLKSGDVEIKRDLEASGLNAVRIMTIHGSKGLQAPIVFLPDTCSSPTLIDPLIWPQADVPVYASSDDQAFGCILETRKARKNADLEEYNRLFYVALTRAEDRLIVAGANKSKNLSEQCWYYHCQQAWSHWPKQPAPEFLAQHAESAEMQVWETEQISEPDAPGPQGHLIKALDLPLPDWAITPVAEEPTPPKPLTPSQTEIDDSPVRSPLATQDGAKRHLRGRIIHRLLQTLPDVAPDRRVEALMRYLNRSTPDWSVSERAKIGTEIMQVLNDPDFAALFGPNSRAEVPVVGVVQSRAISGQVDRMVVTDTEVLVVDYKTNRLPPRNLADIPVAYLRQMAVYRLALACLYPRHTVRAAILWTDGPKLMEIPANRLDEALSQLALPLGEDEAHG